MLATHIDSQADITIAVRPVPWEVGALVRYYERGRGKHHRGVRGNAQEPQEQPGQHGRLPCSPGRCSSNTSTRTRPTPPPKTTSAKTSSPPCWRISAASRPIPSRAIWKDVGTIASLWEANMDLLKIPPEFNLSDSRWPVYARSPVLPPHFIGDGRRRGGQHDRRGLRSGRHGEKQRALLRRGGRQGRRRGGQRHHALFARRGRARSCAAPSWRKTASSARIARSARRTGRSPSSARIPRCPPALAWARASRWTRRKLPKREADAK